MSGLQAGIVWYVTQSPRECYASNFLKRFLVNTYIIYYEIFLKFIADFLSSSW